MPRPYNFSTVPCPSLKSSWQLEMSELLTSPTVKRIGVLLITTFVELRMVAGRSRTRAGRPHAVSGRPMIIHTSHAMPCPRRDHAALCRGL
jgi:hypothetical protein